MRIGLLLVALLVTGLTATAEAKDPYRKFYEGKRQATTVAAYSRATENLRRVAIGMKGLEALEQLKMEVLAQKGEPYDARMDGYLIEASRAANQAGEKGMRFLVFGYVEDGREVPRARIGLREHRVVEVSGLDLAGDIAEANLDRRER